MKIAITFLLVLFVSTKASDIDDLKKLINQRINDASNFVPSEDNSIYREKSTSHVITNYGIFDFVIVGAGTSGSIIANRLTENQNFSVLVLEAGTLEDNFTTIPGLYQYLAKSDKNWNYRTTPQKNGCEGFENHKCPILAGKSVGGSSATFEPFYVRGNSKDYHNWASLGNPDWSYDKVLPYFQKAENSIDIKNSSYHGYEGPIPTTYPNPQSGLYKLFRDASNDDGQEEIDYNGESQDGVSRLQLNIDNGKRASTSVYITDIINTRPNLNITLDAFVTKLLIDESTSYGIQFNKDGQIYRAYVRKDVILAAGAINTAALLLRSGIGPKDELEALGINVFQELNVGINYNDHLIYPGIFARTTIEVPSPTLDNLLDEYVNQNRGLLAKPLGTEGVSFYKYPNTDDVPFTEFIFTPQNGFNFPEFPIQTLANYSALLTEKLFSQVNVTTDFGILLHLYDVKSKGNITLKSADLFDFPNIDPGIFSEVEDLDALVQAIGKTLGFIQKETFLPYNVHLIGSLESCDIYPLHSMDYWYCSMRVLTFPANHITGTTPMGPDASTSVVDQRLRVHGINRLRIADPGVIPVPITGNTNAASMMIGEKASDIIKDDYK